MIIFFNKKTREIIGHIAGRVHPEEVIKGVKITMTGVKDNDIGKFVVYFKSNFKIVEVPKTELRVVDKKTMRVERVVVGKKKIKRGLDMIPDVPFADIILSLEKDTNNFKKYKVKLDKTGEVIGFEKRPKS